jgi:hypothetical protein
MGFIPNPASGTTSVGNTTSANVGGGSSITSGIDDAVTTVPVADGSVYADGQTIRIGDEYILIGTVSSNNLTSCTRGAFNSTAAAHSDAAATTGVFIGASDLSTQPDVMVALSSSTSGSEFFDFSADGTEWSTFPVTGFTVAAGIHEFHIAVKGPRYFRIRFENDVGNAATSSFEITTYFGVFRQPTLPLDQSITADSDSIVVRAVANGPDPNGDYRTNPVSGVNDANSSTTTLPATALNGALTDSSTTVVVTSTTGFAAAQYFYVDSEYVLIGSVLDGTTFASCVRGQLGSTAATHDTAASVGGTFLGAWTNVARYQSMSVLVEGAAASVAPGVLNMQFSQDGSTISRNIAAAVADVATAAPHTLTVIGQYFRVLYVNLSVATTSFGLQTMFHMTQVSLISRLDQTLGEAEDVTNVRSIIAGRDPAGRYRNNPVDVEGHLLVRIDNPTTAFGDMRMADLTPVIQLTFPYNINGDLTTTTTANGGTVTVVDGMCTLTSGTTTNGAATLASRGILKYRAGLGSLARFTARFTTGVASTQQIIGLGDTGNGFFVGYNGTAFGVLRRRSGSDVWIEQTAWNVDTMDGGNGDSNPSGMLLDQTTINVFQIQFQWLGAGRISFFIENQTTGDFTKVHQINYTNQHTLPSTYIADLPVYMYAVNTASTSVVLATPSVGAFVEGKNLALGPTNTFEATIGGSTRQTFFSIQNVTTYVSLTNRVRIYLRQAALTNDAAKIITFTVYLNATLDGTPTWVNVNGTDSVVQSDIVQEYVSGGKILFTAALSGDSGNVFDLSTLNLTIVPGDVVTVVSTNTTNTDGVASLIWQEDF